MGQAKRRGNLEDRIAQASARADEERQRREQERREVVELEATIQPGQRRVLHGTVVCRCNERRISRTICGEVNLCKVCRRGRPSPLAVAVPIAV